MSKSDACLGISADLIRRHKHQPLHCFNNLQLPLANLIHSQGVNFISRYSYEYG